MFNIPVVKRSFSVQVSITDTVHKKSHTKHRRKHDESVGGDEDFFGTPEQRPHKMQRVGEGSANNSRPSSEKRPRRRGEFEVEEVHLGNLTVGEAWPEKRNIVIVGSEETSIPLFCQADMERCALEDASTGELVDIVPGKGRFLLRKISIGSDRIRTELNPRMGFRCQFYFPVLICDSQSG